MSFVELNTVPCAGAPDTAAPIVCFAPAAANAQYWRFLVGELPHHRILAAEYPGRGRSMSLPFMTSRTELVGMLVDELRDILTPSEWADAVFVGHSVGVQIAFEMVLVSPARWLVLSARNNDITGRAPRAPDHLTSTQEELLSWVTHLGGIPDMVTRHPELARMVAKTLRADLALSASPCAPGVVQANAILMCGDSDPAATLEQMAGWKDRIRGTIMEVKLAGDHDAIRQDHEQWVRVLRHALEKDHR
ncbi:thioesterase II family protein [Corynebacterium cystitidis]|uniref:Thioesterase TesA n=1 Tax=Corynebacterium cystitidis DSM 20524 TaxID=1121357 RepID=A0A1H9RES1_9CORY|nr:alpha/beta fold hydrolase [Corynebacterium cystitidis]WJY81456.1 Linear gramicidin dehydrogenase LgrE [Corynebacterium cystitidis DSM 20524]SER71290.1 Surfactin synthase thioesterase subunit [Corynebacterium cystitidis DSM 20524]SNV87312.1 thioesterase [Corynebacterium cystitidis]